MPTPTHVIVLESGAIPPHRELIVEAPDVSVVLAQQSDETRSHFLSRLRSRVDQLVTSSHCVLRRSLVLSNQVGESHWNERLTLGRALAHSVQMTDHACLEISGQLAQSPRGALEFWALIETLTSEVSGPHLSVKAVLESPPQPMPSVAPMRPPLSAHARSPRALRVAASSILLPPRIAALQIAV